MLYPALLQHIASIPYLALVPYLLVSIFHLWATATQRATARRISKYFLMPTLLLFYCVAATEIHWIFVAVLVCAWIGDCLLTIKGFKWLVIGGVGFEMGHVLLFAAFLYLTDFSSPCARAAIAIIILYVIVTIVAFRYFNRILPKKRMIPGTIYVCVSSLMSTSAFVFMMSTVSEASSLYGLFFAGLLCYIGSVVFLISDLILISARLDKNTPFKTHFPAMITYIVALLLITFGFILI